MAVIGLVPLLVTTVEGHYFGKQAIEQSEKGHLQFALKSRLAWLQEWLHFTRKEFASTSSDSCSLEALSHGHATYPAIVAYDSDWKVLATSPGVQPQSLHPVPEGFAEQLTDAGRLLFSSEYYCQDNRIIMLVGHPLRAGPGIPQGGFIVAHLDLTRSLARILGDSSDLANAGRLSLISKNRHYLVAPHRETALCGSDLKAPAVLVENPDKVLHYIGHQGVPVLGVSAPVPDTDWILVAEVDREEAFQWLNRDLLLGAFAGICTLLLIGAISCRSARKLTGPLHNLAGVARRVSAGNLRERVPQFAEAEFNEVATAFNNMLKRLEVSQQALIQTTSLAAVGELSSSIVHEMRNPLSTIKMNVQALADKVSDQPLYEEVAQITLAQTARLETMLNDLLRYGKPLTLHKQRILFSELAASVIGSSASKRAEKKGITIEVIDNLGPRTFEADHELLNRACTHLIDNAISWSPPGSSIRLLAGPIPDREEWLAIAISDQGPGIRPEHRERIFLPFFTTRAGGAGLGRANVKKIIEYHGGTITVESAGREEGCLFVIQLPFGGEDELDSGN